MNRESPLLPVSDAREAALFFVVGALCFLAALAALTTRGTYTAAQAWSAQIEGEISILMRDTDRRAAEAAAEEIETLATVLEARLLSVEEIEALLEPSFGPGGMPEGLPLPLLIAVQADLATGDPISAIEEILDRNGIEAEVSAHSRYASDVRNALGVLRLVALGAVALLAATAVAVIAFATHAALLARRDIVDVLHLSGAEDRYIAGLFERRFWVLALKGGAAGAIAALMVTAMIVFSASNASGVDAQLLPQLSLDFWDLFILILTPIIAGLAARLAARLTVMQSLKVNT
ncbi:MAG: cell division protein FtsX [Henriciella sp.]|nr:cell division protein FtsX [Henriciella sp.]